MEIILDGKKAALPSNFSFQYVCENRKLTDSDEFSLEIILPIRNCPENIEIFGPLNRFDFIPKSESMHCEISHGAFRITGSAVIIETDDVNVKVQFLANRAAHNWEPALSEIYVDELSIAAPSRLSSAYTVADAWGKNPDSDNFGKYLALPWWNSTHSFMNNEVKLDKETGEWNWTDGTTLLSFSPFMLYLAKRICEEINFEFDFSQWEQSSWKYLVCCNTLPSSWHINELAKALPHWTVKEFFYELESLMCGEFDFDYIHRRVSFKFALQADSEAGSVSLSNVLDSFSESIEPELDDDSKNSTLPKFFEYADDTNEDITWRRMTCADLIEEAAKLDLIKHLSPSEFQNWLDYYKTKTISGGHSSSMSNDTYNPLPYIIEAYGRYWMPIYGGEVSRTEFGGSTSYYFAYGLTPIATFAPVKRDENEKVLTLNMVPVQLIQVDGGFCMSWSVSEYSRGYVLRKSDGTLGYFSNYLNKVSGDESQPEFYDKIRIGFLPPDAYDLMRSDMLTHVVTDCYWVDEWLNLTNFATRNAVPDIRPGSINQARGNISLDKVDFTKKRKVFWIGNSVPNPRAIFYIKGKRYLCEKITATFTENGMSQLLKGEFYPLLEV